VVSGRKLAIARAMMRANPLFGALDEPTSALDPLAEDQLFARYAEMEKAAGYDRREPERREVLAAVRSVAETCNKPSMWLG
jgi:energy-coupling factor transporter ATP-binding protein EcfA2